MPPVCEVARELDIRRIIVPAQAGVFSALILEDLTTLLILPEFDYRVDDLGHMHLQVRSSLV